MRKVLVTGMSGTGKSTALIELAKRGFRVVDTDDAPWSEWSEADGGYVWREDLIGELLSRDDGVPLYVSGTVSNQGRFYPQFDAVVLLSASVDVLLRRIETRTSNVYGKAPARSSSVTPQRLSRYYVTAALMRSTRPTDRRCRCTTRRDRVGQAGLRVVNDRRVLLQACLLSRQRRMAAAG